MVTEHLNFNVKLESNEKSNDRRDNEGKTWKE